MVICLWRPAADNRGEQRSWSLVLEKQKQFIIMLQQYRRAFLISHTPSPILKTFALYFFNTNSAHYAFAHLDCCILAMQRILLFMYWSSGK